MPRLLTANPDHVFELHPLIRVAGIDLLSNLRPVDGYKPGHASTTLKLYQRSELAIQVRSNHVYLKTPAGLWNDVHFLLELRQPANRLVVEAADGSRVAAQQVSRASQTILEGFFLRA